MFLLKSCYKTIGEPIYFKLYLKMLQLSMSYPFIQNLNQPGNEIKQIGFNLIKFM